MAQVCDKMEDALHALHDLGVMLSTSVLWCGVSSISGGVATFSEA